MTKPDCPNCGSSRTHSTRWESYDAHCNQCGEAFKTSDSEVNADR